KGVERSQGDALLQIIFVRHHAALGPAASSRRVHDASGVSACAWNEYRLARCAKFFQRSAPASSALGGASVTRTVCTFVDARPPEAPSCRQIGYSVTSTEAPECLRSCHCSSGVSL